MENKINIAMFSDSFYPIVGGRENVINNLMTELDKKANIFLLTTTFNGAKPFITDSEIPYNIIRCKGVRITKNEYLSIVDKKTKKIIEQKIKNKEIDIIHTQTKYALTKYALKLRKKYGIPVITTCHTLYPEIYKKQLKFPPLYKAFIRHSKNIINKMNGVLTVSEFMKTKLVEMGVKRPITVIPNGNDLLKYQNNDFDKTAIKSKYGVLNTDNIFVFIGRLNVVKNIELIFNGLAFLKENSINYKMIMVGNGEIKKYKSIANNLGILDNIIFTGPISDREEIAKIYSISDLNIYPSITETFGLTIREAGSMGTPSIVVENMATAENIINNQTGFITQNDETSFSNCLLKAIKDKKLLSTIGRSAKNNFSISWEQIAEKHLQFYKSIIEKNKH